MNTRCHALMLLSLLVLGALVTGCIDQRVAVNVKKDGSGTIKMQTMLSEAATKQIQTITAMMSGQAPGGAGAAKPAPLQLYKEEDMKKLAAQLGEGVRFKRGYESKTQGWQGFKAEFEFDDVTKLRVSSGMDFSGTSLGGMAGMAGGAGGAAAAPKTAEPAFTVQFAKGTPAKLTIVPQIKVKAPDGAGAAPAMPGGMPAMDEKTTKELEQAKVMFKGMRLSIYLTVEGKITETNAAHQLKKPKPNEDGVILLDFRADELMNNPEVLQKLVGSMTTKDPSAVMGLAKMKIPGLIVEDPEKTLTISFQ